MSAAMAMVKGSVLSLPMTFVSGNAKKLKEVRAILDRLIRFQLLKLDFSELQGEPEDISKEKGKIATKEINGLGLVQHTCLRDEWTGGLLGPHIKGFLQKIGDEGLNNLLMAYEEQSAHAVCIFSLALRPNMQATTFVEKTAGKFGPTRGPNGFGWDPLDVSLLGQDLFVHLLGPYQQYSSSAVVEEGDKQYSHYFYQNDVDSFPFLLLPP